MKILSCAATQDLEISALYSQIYLTKYFASHWRMESPQLSCEVQVFLGRGVEEQISAGAREVVCVW